MTKEQKARLTAAAVVGTTAVFSGVYAMGMTTVVLGAAAAPGAIKTASVLINGQPMVYSLVKASLLSKLLIIGLWVGLGVIVGKFIYDRMMANEPIEDIAK